MNKLSTQIAAAAGAGAVVAGVAIGALTLSSQSAGGFSAEPAEPTAITQTAQLDPTTPEVPEAKPQITGPAPLPTEEQGLPG